ncbi:MAG: beta-lactamase family protein [Kiritimatiellae bacterium]|nr:beta-lactamase family protein [Kiritimatiellia bacterium]
MKLNALLAMAGAAALAGCFTVGGGGAKESGTTFAADALAPYVESGELPGAISIFYDNGVQETACVGYSDAAAKRPITLDDHFMQCSQTKGFCGVTIAKLVEEGKISLDDPVSKYLPEFKNLTVAEKVKGADGKDMTIVRPAKTVLTIRMTQNHTGGFAFEVPNYTSMGGWARRMPLRSAAAVAAGVPLRFDPGTRDSYSNIGIDIGAAIVEVVTGMRWEDYLKAEVFDPLGMEDSTFRPGEEALETKVEMYDCAKGAPAKWRKDHESMRRPYGDDRVFASAGAGLWTTARDQLKFYKMLMNLGVGENGARILKEETVKNLLAVTTRPDNMGGYSLGLTAPKKDGENEWFGHGGAWGTNCVVNWHKKQLKLWVVQLVGGPRPWDRAVNAAADAFFKAMIDNKGVEAYTGRFE